MRALGICLVFLLGSVGKLALASSGPFSVWLHPAPSTIKPISPASPSLPGEKTARSRADGGLFRQSLAGSAFGETIDFLKVATDFADCMLEFGRDRYGPVHTPLFAVLLTREARPRMGPQPLFKRPSPYKNSGKVKTPFRLYDYNCCLNYPDGLCSAGPHKLTFFGCDVYEDRDLYTMLIDLTRITGKPQYKRESEAALRWWFSRTLGPADLYPWGEHLGWDFENECPTYFEGPSKHLYAACYHEIKDQVPFLDFLAKMPSEKKGQRTPLERYALGVWNAHYWDKQRGIYCRHGDYTGKDDRRDSLLGFPAHQGAHLRLWIKTCLSSKDPTVHKEMKDILNAVLDVQIKRAQKYGYIPFTFEVDYKGKKAYKSAQSDRLGAHVAELSVTCRKRLPSISSKLKNLAELLLGRDRTSEIVRKAESSSVAGAATPDSHSETKPPVTVADLSSAQLPEKHAQEIIRRVDWFKQYGDVGYLAVARQQAHAAYVLFCDDRSPLPKANAAGAPTTTEGKPFPDYYFKGAKLMHAFALVAEAGK